MVTDNGGNRNCLPDCGQDVKIHAVFVGILSTVRQHRANRA
jgi:hypothetical protein